MASSAHEVQHSYVEYLALEAASNVKHEFLGGHIYAMAGGSPAHAALTAAVARHLGNAVVGGACRVFSSDLRIRVEATGLSTYPDVTVVCGPRQTASDDPHAVVNPSVLVEVLSPSTRKYDQTEKFEHLQQLPSLQAYVLVDVEASHVEVRERSEGGWTSSSHGPLETAFIEVLKAELPVDAIYAEAADPE